MHEREPVRGHHEHRDRAQHEQVDIPARALLELVLGHRVVADVERLPEMARGESAEHQPQTPAFAMMLLAQLVAEQQVVQRNQHDPVRKPDDADEEEPGERAERERVTGSRASSAAFRASRAAPARRRSPRARSARRTSS